MGFVEAVAGEHFDFLEDFVGQFLADLVGLCGALDELGALFGHFFSILFTHRAAQEVGAAEGVAGEELGGVLHLLLIDHDAVGVAADLFQQRVLVHGGLALFYVEHLIDKLHGSGAIDGDKVDDVVDTTDLVFLTGLDHAAGLKLEHSHGLAAVEHVESGFVGERDFLDIEIRDVPADVGDGVVDDREVFQAEEIHFQEADLGDRAHVVLGDDLAFVATGEGDVLVERAVSDHDSGGVDTDVAVDSLEPEGVGPEFLVSGGGFDQLAQFRLGVPFLGEGDAGLGLDHFRDPIGLAVGDAHDAGDVAEHGFRAHGAVGDDVGNGALAVFLPDVIDDFGAAGLAEIDVDVGR